ncbi:hypothetical protein [uncultured Reyranella sp.]|uniref:hypothetical protein n=1 Tax=uncultured Reyranella sp. TaxID=735512 RepID=UPI00259CE839|nr:hypothetical protein [uncultured Reyranella sp.]
MTLPPILATPIAKAVGLSAVALILMGLVAWVLRDQFAEGKKAGAAGVTNAVQHETIKAQDGARRDREEADEKVHSTPYDDRVDGLR